MIFMSEMLKNKINCWEEENESDRPADIMVHRSRKLFMKSFDKNEDFKYVSTNPNDFRSIDVSEEF